MDAGGGGGAGSGNVSGGDASGCCYYALLGIRKNASATDIRAAYRRLALVSPFVRSPPLSRSVRARGRALD
jgi:hypothetical protein